MARTRGLPVLLLALLWGCGGDDGSSAGSDTQDGSDATSGGTGAGTTGTGNDDGATTEQTTTDGTATASSTDSADTGGAGEITPDCFVPWSDDPILGYGDLLTDATWNDPHVLAEDGGYVMYISASPGFTQLVVAIYRMESDDGYTWALAPENPVLEPTSPSEGVETPAVVELAGQYHLFYTTYPGANDPNTYTVGHAVSDDGIAFTVLDDALVESTGDQNQWNGAIVGEPAPVVYEDELFLYFTAVGVDADLGASSQVIGLVTSTDGSSFGAPELVLEPDRTLYPRADGWVGFSTPSAVVVGGTVHLFTDVANDAGDPSYQETWLQVALQHAASPDGRTGWVQDTSFIHEREDFAWTQREIRAIHGLLDNDRFFNDTATTEIYTLGPGGEPEWHTERWGIGTSECQL
jgi:hypothetical protein